MAIVDTYPVPPVDPAIVDKWDCEWLSYLQTEAKWPHLLRSSHLRVITDVSTFDRRGVFDAVLTERRDGVADSPLHIWANGSDIVGKRVAEIGCGAGFLGKRLALISERYLGIDVSQLALAIARGNSGLNCTYLHLSEEAEIQAEFGRYHTVVGREFFIHQNYDNASWVLRLAKGLLMPGGTICADFYLPNTAFQQGVIFTAQSALDPRFPSCAFIFSDVEIRDLASSIGLSVVSIENDYDLQRKLVVLAKPADPARETIPTVQPIGEEPTDEPVGEQAAGEPCESVVAEAAEPAARQPVVCCVPAPGLLLSPATALT
jgi:2-polyprenyl-3-methyl-5-hydroxy-6-metoxy-1,4-benzoquinol methylase